MPEPGPPMMPDLPPPLPIDILEEVFPDPEVLAKRKVAMKRTRLARELLSTEQT